MPGRPARRAPPRRRGRGSPRAAPAGPGLRPVRPVSRRQLPASGSAVAARNGRRLPPQPGDRAQQPDLDRRAAGAPRGHARARRCGPSSCPGPPATGPWKIMSLNDAGYSHARRGNYGLAIAYCGQALAGSQAAGERNWESAAWDSLGYIHHKLGRSPARHHLLRTVPRPVPGARRPVQRGGHARPSRRRPPRRGRRARGPLGLDSGAAHAGRARAPRQRPGPRQDPGAR